MKWNFKHRLLALGLTVTTGGFSIVASASDFNLPFVNGADLGNMYSGWAASAEDASTSFTNPAGLVKLGHEQLVVAGLGVKGASQFSGTSTTALYPFVPAQTGVASTKLRGFLPTLYFASRMYHNMVLGFNIATPFALGTNYSPDSIVRYAATRSQVVAVDLGPTLGIKINDKLSVGLGFDASRLAFTLNQMYGPPFAVPDQEGQNHLAGWGYGWHAGVLYQVLPTTRVGVSFNSMIVHQTSGDSEVYAPAAVFRTTQQRASVALPARTQLSIDHQFMPNLHMMATVFYTNWRTLQQVTMQQTMLPTGTTMPIVIPFNYHNTFDYSVGFNYQAAQQWKVRTGLMVLTKPSNNRDRSVVDPIGGAIIASVGAHFQQNAELGYDVSYAHGFFQNATVGVTTPLYALSGHSSANTNIMAAQLTWNMT